MTVGNRRGTRYSVGLPGTGMGWYKTVHPAKHLDAPAHAPAAAGVGPPASGATPNSWRWVLVPLQVLWFVIHALLWLGLHLLEVAVLIAGGVLVVMFTIAAGGGGRRRRRW